MDRAPRPHVLPFARTSPEPLLTLVSHTPTPAGWVSAVARHWPVGTGCCGRCPPEECTVCDDHCLVTVPEYVPLESAPGLSLLSRDWLPARGDAGAGDGAPRPA